MRVAGGRIKKKGGLGVEVGEIRQGLCPIRIAKWGHKR